MASRGSEPPRPRGLDLERSGRSSCFSLGFAGRTARRSPGELHATPGMDASLHGTAPGHFPFYVALKIGLPRLCPTWTRRRVNVRPRKGRRPAEEGCAHAWAPGQAVMVRSPWAAAMFPLIRYVAPPGPPLGKRSAVPLGCLQADHPTLPGNPRFKYGENQTRLSHAEQPRPGAWGGGGPGQLRKLGPLS